MLAAPYRRVFQLAGKEWWVLLSGDNEWGFERENTFVPFTTPNACMPLLPLLQMSHDEVVLMVQRAVAHIHADPDVAKSYV